VNKDLQILLDCAYVEAVLEIKASELPSRFINLVRTMNDKVSIDTFNMLRMDTKNDDGVRKSTGTGDQEGIPSAQPAPVATTPHLPAALGNGLADETRQPPVPMVPDHLNPAMPIRTAKYFTRAEVTHIRSVVKTHREWTDSLIAEALLKAGFRRPKEQLTGKVREVRNALPNTHSLPSAATGGALLDQSSPVVPFVRQLAFTDEEKAQIWEVYKTNPNIAMSELAKKYSSSEVQIQSLINDLMLQENLAGMDTKTKDDIASFNAECRVFLSRYPGYTVTPTQYPHVLREFAAARHKHTLASILAAVDEIATQRKTNKYIYIQHPQGFLSTRFTGSNVNES
jgi:hypothetical protein